MAEPTSRRDFLVVSAGVATSAVALTTGCGAPDPTSVNAAPEGDPINFPPGDRAAVPPEGGATAVCPAGSSSFFVGSGPKAEDLSLNQAKPVVLQSGQAVPKYLNKNLNLYVCRDSQGLWGVDVTCTHLGCLPGFVSDKALFVCPCHSSQYNINGDLISGPALKPLPRFAACKGSDGLIHIDLSKSLT